MNAYTFQLKNDKTGVVKVLGDREILPDIFDGHHKLDLFYLNQYDQSFRDYADFLKWQKSLGNPVELPKYTGVIISDETCMPLGEISNLATVDKALFENNHLDIFGQKGHVISFHNYSEFLDWWISPKPSEDSKSIASAVDPDHYKGYLGDLQWLEAMNRMSRFQNNPKIFMGAVELQARKYLDRLGEKDNEAQEILKAVWYLRYLAAYVINGKQPIRVEDIDKLIDSVK